MGTVAVVAHSGKMFGGGLGELREQLAAAGVAAKGLWQWSRTLARTAAGDASSSPFVETARGRKFDVRFSDALPYELDGGDR